MATPIQAHADRDRGFNRCGAMDEALQRECLLLTGHVGRHSWEVPEMVVECPRCRTRAKGPKGYQSFCYCRKTPVQMREVTP